MPEKYTVGIIFCGGCNCYFDRAGLYKEITENFADSCSFFRYSIGEDTSCDLIVLINGCQSECLLSDAYNSKMLLINNKNYKNACEMIRNALMK